MDKKLPALKQQLRRVMSDRALKIVKQSETKKENINNSINQSSFSQFNDSTLSLQTRLASKLSQKTVAAKNLTNKIVLQPIKTFEIIDKESLINHIKQVYDETVKTNGSIIFATQSIINSILHYISTSAEKNTNVNEILRENLFQTNRELSMKYRNDEQNDSLRMEGQMQIMLQIENFIQSSSKQQMNDDLDDFVWEIANSIRWLNQTFKEKFRIEKFLFGEIYSNYYLNASDLVLNLMEELGYDKEDNSNDTPDQLNNSNNTSTNNCGGGNDDNSANNNSKTNDDSVTSSNNNNQSVNNESSDSIDNNNDDILNDSKRKKLVSRFPNASFSMSRSIMVHQRKRLHLKIRSPYKSPSKANSLKWLQNNESLRRSPRIKEKQSLKRTSRCTITDTPIHKQNSTRLTKRQQKIIKRISFQQFKTTTTVIPDTPVKNECRIIIKGTPSPKKLNGFSFQAKFLNK